jgi:hypothetical protein
VCEREREREGGREGARELESLLGTIRHKEREGRRRMRGGRRRKNAGARADVSEPQR